MATTDLVGATTRELVCHVARVRAHVVWDGRWHVRILHSSRWASALIEVLTKLPQPVQLAFPFARLHNLVHVQAAFFEVKLLGLAKGGATR